MITNPGRSQPGQSVGRPAGVLRDAWRSPLVRAWLAATLIGGAAVNALIVYQVPLTTRAGLPLGIAAAVAGFRGLAQLAGRLPLTALTGKLGARATLVLAYTLAAAVTLLLFAGGALAPVLVLSLLAGAAVGAVYSLQGVYAYQLIDPRHLGTLLGIAQAVFAAGGALGPLTAGALLGATGSDTPAVTIISAGFAAAAGLLLLGRAPGQPRSATPPPVRTDGIPGYTAGLRRSIRMTSRQRPWCWPMRSRVPTTRNPAARCRARLAVFSGKMPDWMVQIPAASVEAISASRSRRPMPWPRAAGWT